MVDDIENYVENNLTSDEFHIDDFDFLTVEFDLDFGIPSIPESELRLQFDGMELYVQVDTILSAGATYTLSLYTSETEIGIELG